MQAKSAQGRERAVEHIIGEVNAFRLSQRTDADEQDYIKQLISVFEDAEDLESLEDLHALCSLMQTIRELPLGESFVESSDQQSCSTTTRC
jgi:protein phosphatase-4 regulatory subunit 3